MAKAACVREEDTTVGRCPEDRAKHPVVADDFPAHAAAADRSGDAAGAPEVKSSSLLQKRVNFKRYPFFAPANSFKSLADEERPRCGAH